MVSRRRAGAVVRVALYAISTVAFLALVLGLSRVSSYEIKNLSAGMDATGGAPHLRLAQQKNATTTAAPSTPSPPPTTKAPRRWNAHYKKRDANSPGVNTLQLFVPTATVLDDIIIPVAPTEDEYGPRNPSVMRALADSVEMRTYPRFSLPGPVCVIVLAEGPDAVKYTQAVIDTWGDRSTLIVTTRLDVYNLATTPSKYPSRQVVTTLINTTSFTNWKKAIYDEETKRRPEDSSLLPTYMWLSAITSKFDSLTLQCRWFHFTSPKAFLRLDALEAELSMLPSHEARVVGFAVPHPTLAVFRTKYGYSLSRAVLQREEPTATLKILNHHLFTLLDDDLAVSMCIRAVTNQRLANEPNRMVAAQYTSVISDIVKKATFTDDVSQMPSCILCASIISTASETVIRQMHLKIKSLAFNGHNCPADGTCALALIPGKRAVVGKFWHFDDDFQIFTRYWGVAVHEGETFYSNRDSRRATAMMQRYSSSSPEEDQKK